MREINECTAEVFRRSEKRIKERRKKRNRILALVIPLCLIVTVFSATVLPEMMPLIRTKSDAAEMVGDSSGSGSPFCSYTAVEIQNIGLSPERYGKVTDKVAVTNLFNSIHSLFADVDGKVPNGSESFEAVESDENYGQPEASSKSKGYTIIFTTDDGSQSVYNLSENTLLNVNTNETAVLSDAQIEELLAFFGISE